MTPEELASIPITPTNLRLVANAPCYGMRTVVLRRTADELERALAEVERLKRIVDNG